MQKGLRTNASAIQKFREAFLNGEVSMTAPVRKVAAEYGVSISTVSAYRNGKVDIEPALRSEGEFVMTPLRRFALCKEWR